MWRIIACGLLFNIGWFGCVLASRFDMPLAALPLVVTIVAAQFSWTSPLSWRVTALFVACVTIVGASVDTLMLSTGVLAFEGRSAPSVEFVLWIAAFWANFAAVPNVALRWLRGRAWLAGVLGAVSAPGTYLAGAKLGALSIGEPTWRSMLLIGVEWAVLLPLIVVLGSSLEARGTSLSGSTTGAPGRAGR